MRGMTQHNDRWDASSRSRSPFLETDAAKANPSERYHDQPVGGSVNLQDFAVDSDDDDFAHGTRSGNGRVPHHLHPTSPLRRPSFLDDGEESLPLQAAPPRNKKEAAVTWSSLPRKGQLAILTIARLSEPLTQTSLQAYMFYQLRSFDPSLSDSTISGQAGILQGSFAAAQCVTAIGWGRIADSWGRKKVLLIGVLGTGISCVGFGFSRSFVHAIIFRTLGGALNGNVGVLRTMIAEIIKEKKYQSRAFLILPMCFNIGVIIGPVLGGVLADPIGSYPSVFGPDSLIGGEDGVWWMREWPYALPNLVSAVFLFTSAVSVALGLEETLDSKRDRPDWGLRLGRVLRRLLCWNSRASTTEYSRLATEDAGFSSAAHSRQSTAHTIDVENSPQSQNKPARKRKAKLPFRRIWTSNVLFVLLSHAVLALHVSTFNALWFVFLSAPRFDPSHPDPPDYEPTLPFSFTGGLGLPPAQVGLAMAVLGGIGITLQLFVYPTINTRLGTVLSYRIFLMCFPVAYALAPFLAIVPSSDPAPSPASGILVWFAMSTVLFVQVLARTFALPAAIILTNNCSPHPSVLGTVHGVAQSVSALSRTVGPVVGGWLLGVGLHRGMVGGVWWGLSAIAAFGCLAAGWVYEGSGHEILLEGEEEEEEDRERREAREKKNSPARSTEQSGASTPLHRDDERTEASHR
ncbi:MAG: hypothetical protein M4579_004730 [Chaenotheca gracillima]|nr:MAG: hypothetical protein M4579_004730 [Chaenotheca gracillima]